MTNRPLVLFHAGCNDGACAAWVARQALTDPECVPVQYGQDPPAAAFDRDRKLYILDFSYPRDVMFRIAAMRHKEVICLDHHKTAQAALDGLEIELASNNVGDALTVRFDMGKSGGRLTWEHFFPQAPVPWLVAWTEDRDLWRWELPQSREVSAAISSYPLTHDAWDALAKRKPEELAEEGTGILRYQEQLVERICKAAREEEIAGHRVPSVNTCVLFSEVAGMLAEGKPFGAAWFIRSDGKKQYSLRSTDAGVDVSEVARSLGGGGHARAAGFEV